MTAALRRGRLVGRLVDQALTAATGPAQLLDLPGRAGMILRAGAQARPDLAVYTASHGLRAGELRWLARELLLAGIDIVDPPEQLHLPHVQQPGCP